MANSQNGWIANDRTQVASQPVPGTDVKLTVRKDAAGQLLLEVAAAFDRLVESIDTGRGTLDDWGYAERPIRGGTQLSNHASGTAIDLNATRHNLGDAPTKSFSAEQIARIHQIIGVTGGVVRWGGDYVGRKDSMHFEINDRQSIYDCIRALEAMRRFNGTTPPVVVEPVAVVTPAPAPAEPVNIRALQAFAVRAFPAYARQLIADGVYGPKTIAFIKEFQRRSHLVADGVLGPITLAALRRNGFKG